ncbi:unnamed protein product [Chironomus riparius]|uniref:Uncharacterized protein n=1 Tax=Chironomus riparius TaxID=315576 RepID=A0A9N9RR08_9DIPT|nr:unnamed protein product [Chironomus riparius]
MLDKKWTANEFLCFKLDSGGRFISWVYFTFFCLFLVLSVFAIVFVYVDCYAFQPFYEKYFESFESCSLIKLTTTVLAVGLIIVSLLTCVVFKKLINGINERDHTKMKAGVMFCAIINTLLIIIELYGMFVTFSLLDIIDIALTITICVYFFVCLRSLCEKIQRENELTEKEADPMKTLA